MISLKFSLILIGLLALLVIIPVVRFFEDDEHGQLFVGIARTLRNPLWSFVALCVWKDARKSTTLPKMTMFALWALLTSPFVVAEFIGNYYVTEEERWTLGALLGRFFHMLFLSVCFYIVLPMFYLRRELASHEATDKSGPLPPGVGSLPMLVAFSVSLLYSQGLAAIEGWTGFNPMRYSVVVFVAWAAALMVDVNRAPGQGDLGYLMFCTWMMYGLSYGATGIFITLDTVGARMPAVRQLFLMLTMSFLFACLRLLWHGTIRTAFHTRNAFKHFFVIILFEDLFLAFAFLGMDFADPLFYVMLVYQVVKGVLRDTFFWDDVFMKVVRHFLNLPDPSVKGRVTVLETRWRIMEQNVLSELIAAVVVPAALLFDNMLSFGTKSTTSGLTSGEVYTQVALYGVLFFFELVVHVIVQRLFNKRVRAHAAQFPAKDVEGVEIHQVSSTAQLVSKNAWGGEEDATKSLSSSRSATLSSTASPRKDPDSKEEGFGTSADLLITTQEGGKKEVGIKPSLLVVEEVSDLEMESTEEVHEDPGARGMQASPSQKRLDYERGFAIAGMVTGLHTPAMGDDDDLDQERQTTYRVGPEGGEAPFWEKYDLSSYFRNSHEYWRGNLLYFTGSTLLVVFDAVVALSSIQYAMNHPESVDE